MKTLKLSICISILIMSSICGTSQTIQSGQGGLYVTYEDFVNQKLTYPVSCSNSSDKIKLNDLFGSKMVYVTVNGEKHGFERTKVYGYRSCDNKNYRFYDKEIYQIINTVGFFMYYQFKTESVAKGSLVKKDAYFFSAEANGQILNLNKANLNRTFAHNENFCYKVDEDFNSEKDLVTYDPYLKGYKIQYLYTESLK